MASSLAVLLLTLALFATRTNAFAVHAPRAVNPSIFDPSSQDQWTLGGVQTVRWVTDGYDLDGLNGTVLMGHIQSDGSAFLWTDQPLATNVTLSDGAVNVRCPLNLPTASRYVVALLGDPTNLSGIFSVQDANEPVASTTVYPSVLSTTGNIPPATITKTSVVGAITNTPSSSSTTSTPSTTSQSSTSSSAATPTNTSGGCKRTQDVRVTVVIAAVGLVSAVILGL